MVKKEGRGVGTLVSLKCSDWPGGIFMQVYRKTELVQYVVKDLIGDVHRVTPKMIEDITDDDLELYRHLSTITIGEECCERLV